MSMLYDEETGAPDSSLLEEQRKLEESRQVEEARQLEALVASPAFKRIEDWILSQIGNCKEALVDAKEYQTILRLQQTTRAYSNVLGWINEQVEFGKTLKAGAELRAQGASGREAA